MSDFFSISCGSTTCILNKSRVLSVNIFNSSFNSRQIEISMTDGVNHTLTYGIGLHDDFDKAVAIIQNVLFK